jgi:flagellar basal-body rod protein FlgC
MFGAFEISTSALSAQRVRLDTISSNIANMNTAVGTDGKSPYRRLFAEFQSQPTSAGGGGGVGVRVSRIAEDRATAFPERYEPGNRLADARGYVKYPNVDLSTEMVNALETTRAYEANVTAIETTKSMMNATLRLLA